MLAKLQGAARLLPVSSTARHVGCQQSALVRVIPVLRMSAPEGSPRDRMPQLRWTTDKPPPVNA